jgi:hypothetical protein
MASSEGLEPPTVRLEGACSIQLSYEDKAKVLYQTDKDSDKVSFFVHAGN